MKASEHKHTNALIHETSPYLLQHAHNPVNWYPWNDATLEKAKAENKLILISVGYSACHWCHVMEHESFEDEQVAQLMNDYFICISYLSTFENSLFSQLILLTYLIDSLSFIF